MPLVGFLFWWVLTAIAFIWDHRDFGGPFRLRGALVCHPTGSGGSSGYTRPSVQCHFSTSSMRWRLLRYGPREGVQAQRANPADRLKAAIDLRGSAAR